MWLKAKRSTSIWVCLCWNRGEKVKECVSVFCSSSSQSLFKCLSVTRRELWCPHVYPPHLVFTWNIPLFWLFMVLCCESSELQLCFFVSFSLFLSPVLIDACLIKCFWARVGALPVLKASDLFGVHTHSKTHCKSSGGNDSRQQFEPQLHTLYSGGSDRSVLALQLRSDRARGHETLRERLLNLGFQIWLFAASTDAVCLSVLCHYYYYYYLYLSLYFLTPTVCKWTLHVPVETRLPATSSLFPGSVHFLTKTI